MMASPVSGYVEQATMSTGALVRRCLDGMQQWGALASALIVNSDVAPIIWFFYEFDHLLGVAWYWYM